MVSSSVASPTAWLLVVCTLTFAPVPSSADSPPSYSQLLETAGSIMTMARPGADHSPSPPMAWLKKEWPALFSPVLFQQELWKTLGRLANSSQGWTAAPNVSAQCLQHIEQVLLALIERNQSAISMLDAMGRPSPDIEGFNLNWPGALKECQAVSFINTSTPLDPAIFRGEYCTAVISLVPASPVNPMPVTVATGLCVPDSCSSMDITILLNEAFAKLPIHLPTTPRAICHDRDSMPFDTLAIAGLAVVGVFVMLMVVGTAVDVVYTLLPGWREQRMESLVNSLQHDNLNFHNNHDDILLLSTPSSQDCSPGLAAKLLMAFSVYTNGTKLLNTEQTAGTLGCVHGIRFLSMTWVVLGHTFLFPIYAGSNVVGYFSVVLKRWTFQAIINASVSVDTFFVLSGLLVAYLALKEMKKNGGSINWFKFYFHRFWRLTPPYMLVIFIYLSLGAYWGSGPMWSPQNAERENCNTRWWTNLLYINNLFSMKDICLGQSWYLANDMQFYILSPLIFVPFFYSPLYGCMSALVFLLASIIPPAAITMSENLQSSLLPAQGNTTSNQNSYMDDYYVKPYNRMGPYIIGLVTGYLLYHTNCKVRINKVANMLCWAIATAVALAVLYGLYETEQGHPLTRPEQALYNAVARTAWGAAVAWVIFACVTGHGGFVNTILSWKGLIPLSRLTYCIYLLHIMVLSTYVLSRDTTFYYSDANVVLLFLGLLVVCYMLSVVVSLAFEAPMMALEKLLLPRNKEQ